MRLLTYILAFLPLWAFAQVVPSSCTSTDSVVELYEADAHSLALEVLGDRRSMLLNDIDLPEATVDSLLGALIAVYNATSLPARDSVVELYGIHDFESYALNHLSISGDTSYAWMQNLEAEQWPTGNPGLDLAHDTYGFELEDYSSYSFHPQDQAWLVSNQYVNVAALGIQVANDTTTQAGPMMLAGDGNHIEAKIKDQSIELEYIYGWGDCPAGCIWQYSWVFEVYLPECSVEFKGNKGAKPYPVGKGELVDHGIQVFPNPAFDYLQIGGLEEDVPYQIICSTGKVCINGSTAEGQVDVRTLDSGTYILILKKDEKTAPFPFVKH